jgi:hypothetical protein
MMNTFCLGYYGQSSCRICFLDVGAVAAWGGSSHVDDLGRDGSASEAGCWLLLLLLLLLRRWESRSAPVL